MPTELARFGLRAAFAVWCSLCCGYGPLRADEISADPPSTATEDETQLYKEISQVRPGSSAGTIRRQAIESLPLDRLSGDSVRKVEGVLKNISLFRRLPTLTCEADPEIYHYFLQNPDIAVSTWRALDISTFTLEPVAPGVYQADAGDGSTGRIELLHRSADETLIYITGEFRSPVTARAIEARAVMRLQSTFFTEADGRTFCTHRGDMFVEFPSQTVETVARVIAPFSHVIADRNFKQLTLYVNLMSKAMARNPAWVVALTRKMTDIDPQRRAELIKFSQQAAVVETARNARDMSLDQAVAPWKLAKPTPIDEPPAPAKRPRAMSILPSKAAPR
jgi:hypothetical protein